jgi:3-deoxy-7-phosphoheptulonate synthase
MIIIMGPGHTAENREAVEQFIQGHGYRAVPIFGELRTVIAAVGDGEKSVLLQCEAMPGVEKAMRVLSPYKLVARVEGGPRHVVRIGDVAIGGEAITVMAGPCSVESEESLDRIARAAFASGARILRGGAYKPRTSPYAFRGLGEEGLRILRRVADELGMKVVTEVMTVDAVAKVAAHADILQIGARNMQNFDLLLEVGRAGKPVLLKRGMAATVEEFLMAAEYILSEGNENVILCERGIRTFETATRFTLDINAVPLLALQSRLPIVVDPSHATGRWDLVIPAARAAIAAGADGLIVEVHDDPARAASDGGQSLKPKRFGELMKEIAPIAAAVGRRM